MSLQRKGRDRILHKRDIQKYLDNAGMTQADLARRVGVSKQAVCCVLNGTRHSPRVLDGLRQIGVPETLLLDPRRGAPGAGNGRAA